MQHANAERIRDILDRVSGSTAISVDIESAPSMNKTGNPFYGRITKCSTIHGLVGCSYSQGVRNQAAREDIVSLMQFSAQQPKWGTLESNAAGKQGFWKIHTLKNGESHRYIRIMAITPQKPTYKLDGEIMTDEQVSDCFEQGYLKRSRKPKTQDGLEKEIVWREPRLDHVVAVRMFGDTFVAKIEGHLEAVLRKREQGRLTTEEIIEMFSGIPEVSSEVETLRIEQERERVEAIEEAIEAETVVADEVEYADDMTPDI